MKEVGTEEKQACIVERERAGGISAGNSSGLQVLKAGDHGINFFPTYNC